MPTPAMHAFRKTFVASLWLGALGSPLIWAFHLQVLYALVTVANRTQNYAWLYGTTAICCLLSLACGFVSWRDWQTVRNSPQSTESSSPAGRTRFLCFIGMAASVFFALTIFVTGLTAYFFKANWG